MLFEQVFSGRPGVAAGELARQWVPSRGEWLSAQVAAGFDRTTSARLMEAADIARAEADAGESDAAWMLRRAAAGMGDEMGEALSAALDFSGAKDAGAPHAHALTEKEWKASSWYRKEIPFRPDMTPTRARIMAENFDERRRRDRLIAAGSERYDGLGNMALGFGAALLGSLPDPVNFIPFGGGLTAARTAGSLGKAVLAGARAGAVEGAAATALVDAVVLPDLASRGEDVGFADLALDVLAGGVLGSVIGAGGGALARRSAMRRGAEAVPGTAAKGTPEAEAKGAEALPEDVRPPAAGEAAPGTLEAAEAVGPLPEIPPARNADNDALRGTLTAGDRRTLAAATDAALDDIAAARPVDVGEALREAGVVERTERVMSNPVVVRSTDLGVPDGADIKEYIAAAKTYHDALKLEVENGKPVVQPQLDRPVRFSRKGWRKNQSTGADAEKWKLFPRLREIIETSTLKSTEAVNKPRKDDFVRFHWVENVVELDGTPRLVGVMLAEDADGNLFYNLNADVKGWRRKKGDPSNLPAQSMTGESGSPIREEPTGSPAVSMLPENGDGVNLHVEELPPFSPDYSPAAEAPALPVETWETPEAARLAEMEELAGQDEALRLGMEELEARGAADADDIAAARTENGDTGALGHEVMDCAWTVEV